MKRTLLLLAFMPFMFASCSSDEDDSVADFVNTDIVLTPQATKVKKFGQYQIHKAELPVKEDGAKCRWSFSSEKDEGFVSDNSTFDWWPKSTGKYTITATLSKNGKTKTITKQCEVVECQGGFGFAYQPASEITANETMYSAYYYHTTPDMEMTQGMIGSKTYTVFSFKDPGKRLIRKYYFGDEGLYTVINSSY